MEALLGFITDNLGLTKEQQRLIVRSGWVLFVSFHIAWVCGWLAVLGMGSPFALADEQKQLAEVIKGDRIDRLEHDILGIRQDQCKAYKEGNMPAERLYAERLQELLNKYYSLTQRNARVPACDEV